jgi:hypothetical protein
MFKQSFCLVLALFLLGACTSDRSFQSGGVQQLPVAETPEVQHIQPEAVSVPATDGDGDNVYEGGTEQALNHPPEITTVGFVPEVFMPGDRLGVKVSGDDADGDKVTFTIHWTVNGAAADEGTLCTVPLRRGDKVAVRITPYDGMDYGKSMELEREIINFPPQIQADEKSLFDGTVFQYQVKATDPDGDRLAYFLLTAPPGMTIVSTTGQIEWVVPVDFAGVAPISILVEDGHGGKATYDVKVKIREESASL